MKEISKEHIINTIRNRFELTLKSDQVNVIHALLNEKENVILIVKTGFEKSIIFQATSFMYSVIKIALIIMSLKALKEEQCKKLKRIVDCVSFVLDEDSNQSYNLKRIRASVYTHDK